MSERILIVEDDANLADGLAYNLEKAGYEVARAADGEAGLQRMEDFGPDLVILDLMLPGISGMEVIERLRGLDAEVPVMILSAIDEETEKVRGFSLGAVDYVTKPFGLAELLARIRVRLSGSPREPCAARVALGDGTALLDDFAFERAGRRTALTPTEVEILRHLAARAGAAITRHDLVKAIWGLSAHSTRTLDTHVARLRRKVESDPKNPRHIQTVHGVGYRFVP